MCLFPVCWWGAGRQEPLCSLGQQYVLVFSVGTLHSPSKLESLRHFGVGCVVAETKAEKIDSVETQQLCTSKAEQAWENSTYRCSLPLTFA